MNDFFKRRQDVIILAVLFVISMTLLGSNLRKRQSVSLAENAALTLLSPFQEAVEWMVTSVYRVWDRYVYLVDIKDENSRLRKLSDKLAFENMLLVERLKAYQRLDSLLEFPSLDNTPFEAARVIGRDPTDRAKLLILNKGTNHGIAANMPVVTHRGVVGRIVSAGLSSSKALLITDVRSAIDGIAQETRESLLVVGANAPTLEVKYLGFNAQAKNGDIVISSGLGGIFPKGLMVGALEDVKPISGSLFLSAKLRPAEDFGRLEEAIILKTQPIEIQQEASAK
ncbi:MAG: rod shape-determining protein MreC [Nitrospinae bacterium]|nr:rod shape-determining protein MreC [Nitrospinota bacterium]